MIEVLSIKGLNDFSIKERNQESRPNYVVKLRLVLGRLGAAVAPKDLDFPGLDLHLLGGKRAGTWSVSVSGNWRVTFRFEDGHAELVNYEDYH